MHAEPFPNNIPAYQKGQTEESSQLVHNNEVVESVTLTCEAFSVVSENTNMEVAITRLPRKEWRKFKKKQRKKMARIESAKLREQQEFDRDTKEINETDEAEERKRNAERILWEVRERQIDQANAEKRKKQDEEERRKKIIQENWEKTVKNIRTQKIPKANLTFNEISEGQSNTLGTSIPYSTISSHEELTTKSDYGTEKDQVNCPFYLKTGACRFGDSCGRHHSYPDKSATILIKNMYEGMPVQLADEDNDDNLEFDEIEAERHYNEFFEDVHSEFSQYGTIIQFKDALRDPHPNLMAKNIGIVTDRNCGQALILDPLGDMKKTVADKIAFANIRVRIANTNEVQI
ncbi:4790_t:CDS:2 [Acaulospora colombiana]|uniref:4790_t:CDS:1 n=1 Tax=Acaulospora colombiana TaxID=27376 RepID=A0ACA9KCI1_9GLOM|nr:4790_t:CDS:2 [Acaulospora colombiana]